MVTAFCDGPSVEDQRPFQAWREQHWENAEQVFANVRTPQEWMVHTPACPHFEGTDADWRSTRYAKVCGTREAITALAAGLSAELVPCSTCQHVR